MPFSFTQIEQEKTSTIKFSLGFLLFFYFLSALAIVYFTKTYFFLSSQDTTVFLGERPWPALDGPTVGWTLLGALLVGAVHWQFSQHGLINGVIQMMSARVADENAHEERVFRNVVEEAGVATGGKYKIEPYIIPTAASNAFALQDFKGRCIIGITEGLLKRLNREQLEAVVAHEAGHIASGDCLETTTTSALFKTFDNICDVTLRLLMSSGRMGMLGASFAGSGRSSRRGNSGGFVLFFLLLFILASVLRFIGFLGSMFISRQREYRADAIAAKLTRNPLALAEALHIIDGRWKGSGMPGDRMEAIFISNPRKNELEQSSSFIADIFTTHPPIEKRIAVLLNMAHATRQDLDAAFQRAQARYEALNPVEVEPKVQNDPLAPLRGPLGPIMMPLPGVAASAPLRDHCPRCQSPLTQEVYEASSIFKCFKCEGFLVKELDVLKIVHTRGVIFDERIRKMGDLIRRQVKPLRQNPFDGIYDEKSIVCPSCLDHAKRMHRRFVSPQLPVEVDKCKTCARVWFDKDEIEVLQYLYELDHPVSV